MLAWWMKFLPYIVVIWMAKRNAERFDFLKPGYSSVVPFRDEVISWSNAK